MSKSSIDYAELAGLTIALASAKLQNTPAEVITWLNTRIEVLKAK
jgi:hypothetical protein